LSFGNYKKLLFLETKNYSTHPPKIDSIFSFSETDFFWASDITENLVLVCEVAAEPSSIYSNRPNPPTDGGGLRDFYHNWTNSILQQMKRKFWKIADALFRIS
jgi:hypothetical protein